MLGSTERQNLKPATALDAVDARQLGAIGAGHARSYLYLIDVVSTVLLYQCTDIVQCELMYCVHVL